LLIRHSKLTDANSPTHDEYDLITMRLMCVVGDIADWPTEDLIEIGDGE